MKQIVITLLVLVVNVSVYATVYYSDPVNGSMSNPGTSTQPWANLETIFNSGQTFNMGDVILLRNGNHGFPKINGVNTGYVTIKAQAGQTPILNRVYVGNVSATSFWKLDGLTIQSINVSTYPISLITLYPSTSNIVIENCTIQSTNNTTMYSRNDWRTKTNNGIRAQGNNHIIQNNILKNIAVGLSVEAYGSIISNNTIQYFTIDGIRGLANNCIYQQNTVLDNIVVFTYAENHYDGFQSYTCCPVGTDTLKNVIIRQNLIINTTDTTRQWQGPMQGISCFDGFFENWTVENNVVIVDHWHGVTLLGAINCRIINNTCVDPYDVSPIDPYDTASTAVHGPPWVSIKAHKNGSPSYNNTIQNNIASTLNNDVGIGTVSNNVLIGNSTNYPNHFVNYLGLDYHLISASTAIDAGTSTFAPNVDKDNVTRPQGLGYDAGAYEFLPTIIFNQSVNICNGDSLQVGNSIYTTGGNYADTLQTNNGNDSIVNTTLTINNSYELTNNVNLCYGEVYVVGQNTYTQSGNYSDTLTTLLGCDSIIHTNLMVEGAIDVSVSISSITLTANQGGQNYQWINCLDSSLIIGATNQSFTPQQNGNYAVVISQNNICSDTSLCYTVQGVGIKEVLHPSFELYPNPTQGDFTVQLKGVSNQAVLIIYNQLGQKVYQTNLKGQSQLIQPKLSHGVYQIVVIVNNQKIFNRLIIE